MPEKVYPVQKMIYSRLRPVRIAIFVDENDHLWRETCLRIIEWNSQSWGGFYNIIIPTNGQRILDQFWFILEKYDPDYMYTYGEPLLNRMRAGSHIPQELRTRLNPFSSLPRTPQDLIQYPIHAFDRPPPSSADLIDILPGADQRRIMDIDLTIGDKDLKLSIYSLSGKLDAFKHNLKETLKECKGGELLARRIDIQQLSQLSQSIYRRVFHKKDLYQILHLIWKMRSFTWFTERPKLDKEAFNYLPFSVSMINLDTTHSSKEAAQRAKQPPVLVLGNSIQDFCLYYSLSRMRPDVFWLPERTIKKARSKSDKHPAARKLSKYYIEFLLEELGDRLQRLRSSVQKVLVTSLSRSHQSLTENIKVLGQPRVVIQEGQKVDLMRVCLDIRQLLSTVDRVYETGNWENSYLHEFRNGEDTKLLETPIPKSFSPISPHHHWVTEVEIEECQLPAKRALARSIFDYQSLSFPLNQQVRISNEGICYWCPKMGLIPWYYKISPMSVLRPRLRIPSELEVFEDIFDEAGYRAKYSDCGDYIRESLGRFGSLDEAARFFLDCRFQEVFRKFIDHSENKPCVHDDGVFLDKTLPRLLDWKAIEKIIADRDKSARFIDELVAKAVLERGFLFQCEYCRNSAWYGVSEIKESFVCGRCKRRQTWRRRHWKEPVEGPHLYYRLDQIVFQALQEGMIPLILCLCTLKKDTKSFQFVPGIELRKRTDQEKPDLEIDICSVTDGKLVLGEVTAQDRLHSDRQKEKQKIEERLKLSRRIRPIRFVFATYAEKWNRTTEQTIKDKFGKLGIRAELWNKKDFSTQ